MNLSHRGKIVQNYFQLFDISVLTGKNETTVGRRLPVIDIHGHYAYNLHRKLVFL